MVYKAVALAQGPNTRVVVTTRTAVPRAVDDWDVDRGEPEVTAQLARLRWPG